MLPTISLLSYTGFSYEICADWDSTAKKGIWTGQSARDPQPESQALLH